MYAKSEQVLALLTQCNVSAGGYAKMARTVLLRESIHKPGCGALDSLDRHLQCPQPWSLPLQSCPDECH